MQPIHFFQLVSFTELNSIEITIIIFTAQFNIAIMKDYFLFLIVFFFMNLYPHRIILIYNDVTFSYNKFFL